MLLFSNDKITDLGLSNLSKSFEKLNFLQKIVLSFKWLLFLFKSLNNFFFKRNNKFGDEGIINLGKSFKGLSNLSQIDL